MPLSNSQKQSNYRKRIQARKAECLQIIQQNLEKKERDPHCSISIFDLIRMKELLERN